jgi:hypothetical protein
LLSIRFNVMAGIMPASFVLSSTQDIHGRDRPGHDAQDSE